jgi:leucyl-tRNA synthetase
MASYPFIEIENKWQKYWTEHNVYAVKEDISKPKYYVLDMFPYPSGAGLHIGHPEGYTATDIIARYKTLRGFNVLHPMGFDAFGLPTERYSMVTGIHPAIATETNIENFKRQLNLLGLGYDWNRSVNTTDPSYYKWTQWMFLKIYNSWYDENLQKARPISELPIPDSISNPADIEAYTDAHRLAYTANIPVNWCEELGTVLANEEVDEWKDKGYTVERRPMRQWMIRITKYADRLLTDLELVEWPVSTKEMQKHWIGKSEGAEVSFKIDDANSVHVFTTRPDTIFGATYLVLAPEHPLVDSITIDSQKKAVEDYRVSASLKSDLERTELSKEKTGVDTGAFAINPANQEPIQIWIADYVLAHYGTGAIMAVPGHDERDHAFASQFSLPIIQVVKPLDDSNIDVQAEAYTEYAISMASDNPNTVSFSGLSTEQAKKKCIEWLEQSGIGHGRIQFRLRDWLFSRQRYWGEPIPIVYYEDGTKRALEYDELPLTLPEVKEYKPAGTGESPLATVDAWINWHDPKTGKVGKLETNTMPQWAGSCWYYLRYMDPYNPDTFCDTNKEQYWSGKNENSGAIDLYVGGAEHAVLHLLYARFWHKVLFDHGLVSTKEPFAKLFHQGLILGEDGRKMSKSLGNVVNPDDIVKQYGADSLRLFEMFMGPLEAAKPWSSKGVEGVNRFLNRAWRLIADEEGTLLSSVQKSHQDSTELEFVLHSTIKKVGEDIESLSFNTAISQMMILVNEYTASTIRSHESMSAFIRILSPFAPHMCEELWQILGNDTSITKADWPEYNPDKLQQSTVEIVLQVNSKIRSRAIVPADANEDAIKDIALNDEVIKKHLEGLTIRKSIIVPGKLVNFIAN